MPAERNCSQCGAPLPANAPGNRCPKCLLQLALDESAIERGAAEPQHTEVTAVEKTTTLPESDVVIEQTGMVIGRYKLLQQIGEGGFGVVFMAEQSEPVQRKVALKVIKAGMDTREIIARFEAERQALALMDHPNIAQVLDGGATASGRPYFVMELVKGVPVTDYCDHANLSTHERLELFIKVCRAVQHAHQKGVIHRDLKPSNVLVTLHDGAPVPKVIDFGVAKALGHKLTDKTLFTRFEQLIGTPAYMSPEQAALSGLDVDTRSDIYSLGVLLYELLTGVTPLDAETLRKAALDEIRRMIQETEPPKPSTRLVSLGERLADIAKCRHAEPAALTRLVRGDLDWITMKALDKDRRRRYETVNGLMMDIERHLNHEPVVARPPSAAYRFQRAIQRHRLAFTTGGVVALALVLGAVVSTWQAIRATRAEREQARLRQEAQTEAAKSQQVAQFLKNMLKGVGPSFALGRDTAMLREVLDQTAKDLNQLRDQPSVQAELRTALGNVYADLNEFTNAEAMHREALAIRRKSPTNEQSGTAASLDGLAYALWNQGKLTEAESFLREALALQRKLFGMEHADVATSLHQLGQCLRFEGRTAESEAAQREALAIRRKVFGDENADVAHSLNDLGSLLNSQQKLIEAESLLREALAIRRKLFGQLHPSVAEALDNLGRVLQDQGKLTEAEAMHRESLAMQEKLIGSDHPHLGFVLRNLGRVLWKQVRLHEAEAALRRAVVLNEKLSGNEHPEVAAYRANLLRILEEQGKFAEAEDFVRETVASKRKLLGDFHPEVGAALSGLVDLLQRKGKLAEAEEVFEQMIQSVINKADAYWRRAFFYERMEKYDSAIADFEKAIALKPDSVEYCRQLAWNYARYPAKFRSPEKALPLALKAVELTRTNTTELNTLGMVYFELGRLEEAVATLTKAIELNRGATAPLYWRAAAYEKLGDYEKAGADLEKKLTLEPASAGSYNDLAWRFVTCPEGHRLAGKALPLALKAVELSKRAYAELNTLGVVHCRLGQFEKAVATLEEAIQLPAAKGGGPLDFFPLAVAYQRLDQPTKAESHFNKALSWIAAHGDLYAAQKEVVDAFRTEAEDALGKSKAR